MSMEAGKLLTWDRRTSGPAFIAAVVYLIAWSVLVLYQQLSRGWFYGLLGLMLLIWIAFIVDYIVRISLTAKGARVRFVFTHPLDLLAVILPFLRPVAQLTHLSAVPLFQRKAGAGAFQRARILLLAAAFVILFVYSIALAVLNVERNAPGATIVSFGDAIWWACVTLFTVGYGDTYPVTVPGRVFAVLLMMGGFAIIGVASAVVGSYLTERVKIAGKAEDTGE